MSMNDTRWREGRSRAQDIKNYRAGVVERAGLKPARTEIRPYNNFEFSIQSRLMREAVESSVAAAVADGIHAAHSGAGAFVKIESRFAS